MKFVVAFNSKASLAECFNAVGHLCLGMPNILSGMDLRLRKFKSLDLRTISVLTDYPLIILSARNQTHLLEAYELAISQDVSCNAFLECMKTPDPEWQSEFVSSQPVAAQHYLAIALFGSSEQLKPITRKFSLFREDPMARI